MVVSIILLILFFVSFLFYREIKNLNKKLIDQKREFEERIVEERKAAVKTSRSVIKGQVNEQIAPFLPDFKYNSADCKFLGQPIDIIVFNGISEENVTEVIIMDIKTGQASLSKTQRQIKKCIEEGKFRFEIFKAS